MTPFFIVGAGRSGTTLLQQLLSRHSRVAVTPETHYLKRARLYDDDAEEGFDRFWTELTSWQRFRDLGVPPAVVLRRIDQLGPRDFRTVFLAMLETYGERFGKPRVGEKTPGHVRHLPELLSWFPDARIVVIRRDPRAVIASHLRSPWVTDQLGARDLASPYMARLRRFHLVDRARLWRDAYETRLASAQDDERFCHVAYEDLVTVTEPTVRRVCDHLGETFEPAMLDPSTRKGAPTTDGPEGWEDWVTSHETKARGAVTASSLSSWRDELSESDVALIEAVCGDAMRRFGYEPEASPGARARARLKARALMAVGDAEDLARRSSGGRLRRADGYQASVRPFGHGGSRRRTGKLAVMDSEGRASG